MTVVAVSSKGELHKPDALKDEFLLTNFALNSTSEIDRENGGRFIGNPTECALLAAADKAGRDYRSYRSGAEILHVYPFSSETKNMTTVVRGESGIIAYSKGSPEKILSMCALLPEDLTAARLQIEGYQKKACRVIAFSHKVLEENTDYDNARPEIESDMLYDGFVAISDPLRGEVAEAVASCRSAGIDLKMLTGDNIITARAIAEELEMLDEKGITVEARDIEAMSDEELKAALPDIRVIARSTPLIKMRVVKALKSLGHVVAVTGDGINDAPAIKNADVGIAMGISGTEVSKEAGDIVLLDDSFATIVKAVHWGRGIYENFQRFLQFQLTVNLASVAVVLTTVLMGLKAPFTALQLLWVNIIMDGPPALTLGMEPINLYADGPAWRVLIVLFNAWKSVGYSMVVYMAAVTGVDTQLHESAQIDGANIFQRIHYVTLPAIRPTIITMVLLDVSKIFRGNLDLFYQLIGKNGALYDSTDVIDTFVFRSLLETSDIGMAAAAGFYQSILCFVTIMVVNGIIRKINSDYALF